MPTPATTAGFHRMLGSISYSPFVPLANLCNSHRHLWAGEPQKEANQCWGSAAPLMTSGGSTAGS